MYEYSAEVLRVVDGDTVDVLIDCGFSTFRKERVRLHGIDAYESRTRDKEEKSKGLAAKARLQELIKNTSQKVIIKTELDKKGKYGRILGVIWDKNKKKNFNKMLISEGHAVEYFGGKK
jgi:micrococcal nuclease|tara:strand:+ start:1612 stop:1968 length:357 start_codon:yes stop_codon:yes gene_type:complete